ncbi:hypothetical protein FQN55_005226 [Onygenales sp. PD_40]|nr:hypothetical protein FQN55_005226 [Onygenales sp. PD_40]
MIPSQTFEAVSLQLDVEFLALASLYAIFMLGESYFRYCFTIRGAYWSLLPQIQRRIFNAASPQILRASPLLTTTTIERMFEPLEIPLPLPIIPVAMLPRRNWVRFCKQCTFEILAVMPLPTPPHRPLPTF